jgi:hypothetical protein
MPILNRIAKFATSPQGRRLFDQARTYAQSPQGRRQIAQLQQRMEARRARTKPR